MRKTKTTWQFICAGHRNNKSNLSKHRTGTRESTMYLSAWQQVRAYRMITFARHVRAWTCIIWGLQPRLTAEYGLLPAHKCHICCCCPLRPLKMLLCACASLPTLCVKELPTSSDQISTVLASCSICSILEESWTVLAQLWQTQILYHFSQMSECSLHFSHILSQYVQLRVRVSQRLYGFCVLVINTSCCTAVVLVLGQAAITASMLVLLCFSCAGGNVICARTERHTVRMPYALSLLWSLNFANL